MKDKELYLNFLRSLGFQPTDKHPKYLPKFHYKVDKNRIYLGQGSGPDGYYSWFEFDDEGKIIDHGASD